MQHDFNVIWKALDKKQKLNPDYLVAYASHLIHTGKSKIAEELLIKGFNAQSNEAVLALYMQLDITTEQKLQQLEKWLRKQTATTELFNALAQLCLTLEQWNKAKTYLNDSITLHPTSLAYLLLGQAQEHLDEPSEDVNASYKAGLELSINKTALNTAANTG